MGQLSVDVRFRHDSGFEIGARFDAGDGVTALVGPSGGGKSTILHLIAGVLRPSAGAIRLGGRTLVDTVAGICLPPDRRLVGLVFQDHLLFPHLTVRQNLQFGTNRRGGRPVNFDRVVDVLELGELLSRQPATLSGGQRQRVALGRALLRGPELLLLDEPLAALDPALKERILSYLARTFAEWRIPTLLASHEQADVAAVAGQVVTVRAGRVVPATARADSA
jgi:molybdate transport system ATP-binding protein